MAVMNDPLFWLAIGASIIMFAAFLYIRLVLRVPSPMLSLKAREAWRREGWGGAASGGPLVVGGLATEPWAAGDWVWAPCDALWPQPAEILAIVGARAWIRWRNGVEDTLPTASFKRASGPDELRGPTAIRSVAMEATSPTAVADARRGGWNG